jgi:hypothetical protein
VPGANRHYDADNFPHREPRDENPLRDWVHPFKRRRIVLKSLVTAIRLSPWATPGDFEKVGWWVKCKNPLTPTPEERPDTGLMLLERRRRPLAAPAARSVRSHGSATRRAARRQARRPVAHFRARVGGRPVELYHSARMAVIGSMREARRAGR